MKKIEKVEWNAFFNEQPVVQEKKSIVPSIPVITATVVICLLAQDFAHAQMLGDAITVNAPVSQADGDGWSKAKTAILHLLDYTCWGVIVFSGGSWLFGHKNKALDLLLSCGIGTIIIRHADDIERFFQSI